MHEVFISYTKVDEQLAQFVHDHLLAQKIPTFLASLSIEGGQAWSPAVWNALKLAKWVIFMASREACRSAFVQQEIGAAIVQQKNLIPIVWDQPPSALPGWTSGFQAIDLSGKTMGDLQLEVTQIASRIKSKRGSGLAILGFLALGIALAESNK